MPGLPLTDFFTEYFNQTLYLVGGIIQVLGPHRVLHPYRVLGRHRVLAPLEVLDLHKVLGTHRVLGSAFPVCLLIEWQRNDCISN